MPIYEFTCDPCDQDFDLVMRMSEYSRDQKCPECGADARRVIRTSVNFNLPGDDWATKNNRLRGQMKKRTDHFKRKTEEQKRDAPPVTLAPNVDGERTDTWVEARKLAASKGKDPSSYDKMVKKEQEKKNWKRIEVT